MSALLASVFFYTFEVFHNNDKKDHRKRIRKKLLFSEEVKVKPRDRNVENVGKKFA